MTARDDAIEAINNAAVDYQTAGDLLDAIPADVLARLAIERGALISVKWCMDEMCNGEHTRLYRLDPR